MCTQKLIFFEGEICTHSREKRALLHFTFICYFSKIMGQWELNAYTCPAENVCSKEENNPAPRLVGPIMYHIDIKPSDVSFDRRCPSIFHILSHLNALGSKLKHYQYSIQISCRRKIVKCDRHIVCVWDCF